MAIPDQYLQFAWPTSRSCWSGVFSKDILTKSLCRDGRYVEDRCGTVCPHILWSNAVWKKTLNPITHQYWNERRIRRNLRFWTEPAFGKYTRLEAEAEVFGVPKGSMLINPARLKKAFEVFEAMFPEGARWKLAEGFAYPGGASLQPYEGQLLPGVMRFRYFAPSTRDFRVESPTVKKAYEEARSFLGLKTQQMTDRWYAEAAKLISEVPGGEDQYNVRMDWNMIAFQPGKMEVNGWIFKFLALFGQNQLAIGLARPAIAASVASKLPAKMAPAVAVKK